MNRIAAHEVINLRACYDTADFNGNSLFDADHCNNGALKCVGCPFNGVTYEHDLLRVVSARLIKVGITNVLFVGDREQCLEFMRGKHGKNVELMYRSGQLSSWLL